MISRTRWAQSARNDRKPRCGYKTSTADPPLSDPTHDPRSDGAHTCPGDTAERSEALHVLIRFRRPVTIWARDSTNQLRGVSCKTLIVGDKRFGEMKRPYLDAFELFARLSIIGLGVALFRGNDSNDVPTKNGSMSIWDFEAMDNRTRSRTWRSTVGRSALRRSRTLANRACLPAQEWMLKQRRAFK